MPSTALDERELLDAAGVYAEALRLGYRIGDNRTTIYCLAAFDAHAAAGRALGLDAAVDYALTPVH